MNRWLLSGILLFGSLGVTVALYLLGFPYFFLFLFFPLIPLFGRKPPKRTCPVCGWETTGTERFCPWDASPLRETAGEKGEGKN